MSFDDFKRAFIGGLPDKAKPKWENAAPNYARDKIVISQLRECYAELASVDSRDELLAMVKRLLRWTYKGIGKDAFRDCVLPRAALADAHAAEALIARYSTKTHANPEY